MRYNYCMMNVKEIMVNIKKVDVEEIFSSLLVVFLTVSLLVSSGLYYFFVGKNYKEMIELFYFPPILSLQFLLTLLSIFSLWILKNKPISYAKPFNLFLFANILMVNLNLFVSVLLVIIGLLSYF